MDVGSYIRGKGGREDDIDIVTGKTISLREVSEFLNISRRVSREGPKVLFNLGKILKGEWDVNSDNP